MSRNVVELLRANNKQTNQKKGKVRASARGDGKAGLR